MLYLVHKGSNGICSVLDTEDGVVDTVTDQDLEIISDLNLKVTENLTLSFCALLYRNMTKYITLGRDFDTSFYKEFYNHILVLSRYNKKIKVPNGSLYSYDIKVECYISYFIITFKRINPKQDKDYLYLVSNRGIFYFNQHMFRTRYGLSEVIGKSDELIIQIASDKYPMTYGVFMVDSDLNILKQDKYVPVKEMKVGKQLMNI